LIIIVSVLFFVVAENDKTTYIELSAFSSTVAIILLIALVITCIKFVNIFFFLNKQWSIYNSTILIRQC
jgi:hypothetical protein